MVFDDASFLRMFVGNWESWLPKFFQDNAGDRCMCDDSHLNIFECCNLLPWTAFRLLPYTGPFVPRSKSFQVPYSPKKIMQYSRVALSIPRTDTSFDGQLLHLWGLFFALLTPCVTTRYIQAFPYGKFFCPPQLYFWICSFLSKVLSRF